MAKITLDTISSGFQSTTQVNNNNSEIATNLNDKVLYRDNPSGESNEMLNLLDMNSQKIINLPAPTDDSEPARWIDVKDGVSGVLEPIPDQTSNAGVPLTTTGSALVFGPITSDQVNYQADNNFTGGVDRTQENKNAESVSVLDFGIVGDAVADDTDNFNACRTAARNIGAHVLIPAGVDVRVISQLVMFDNEVWQLDGNIIRDWTTTDTDKLNKATIRNEHAMPSSEYIVNPGPNTPANRNTGIKIFGSGEIRNSAAVIAVIDPDGGPYAGPHLLFHASDEMHFGPITLRGPCAEWATMFWGDNVHYDNLKVRDQSLVFEDGIHIVAGTGHTGIVDVQSGDDSLAIINNFNQGISAVSMTVKAESISGQALSVGLIRTGSTVGFLPVTEKVEDIYVNAVGTAGSVSNALVGIFGDVPNANYDRVDGVVLDLNLKRGDGAHDLSSPFCVFMTGGKNIKMRGNVEGSSHQAIFADDITDVDFDLNIGAPQEVGFDTVVINDGADIKIAGTVEAPSNRAGIELNTTSAVVTSKISGIQSGQSGVLVDTGSVVRFNGKAEGVAGSRCITALDTASEIYIGNEADVSGVEKPVQFTANPAIYRAGHARGLSLIATIASGVVNTQGETELSLLGEGGATDGLVTLNNGQKGQLLTLRNGEAVPGTVIINILATGNIVLLAGNYALDTSEKAINLVFDGLNWQEVARY